MFILSRLGGNFFIAQPPDVYFHRLLHSQQDINLREK